MRYTRRARLRGETGPVADPAVERAAGLLGEGPRFARTRSGAFGRKGVIAVAVCLMLAATAVMASLPMAQLGTAANGAAAANDATAAPPSAPARAPPTLRRPPLASPSDGPQAGSAAPATAQPRVGTPIPGSAFLAYTVRAGDTLSRIANAFGLSTTTLYWANSDQHSGPTAGEDRPGHKDFADGRSDDRGPGGRDDHLDRGQVRHRLTRVHRRQQPIRYDPRRRRASPRPRRRYSASAGQTARRAATNWLGKLLWPAYNHYRITQLFGCTGWPGEPRWGTCRHFHDGLDIGGPTGVPVLAAAAARSSTPAGGRRGRTARPAASWCGYRTAAARCTPPTTIFRPSP